MCGEKKVSLTGTTWKDFSETDFNKTIYYCYEMPMNITTIIINYYTPGKVTIGIIGVFHEW